MRYLKLSLILALMAVFMSSVSMAYNEPSDPGEIKGVRGARQSQPPKVYVIVRFPQTGPNAELLSGDVVVWDTTSADGVTINTTTTSGDNAVAGIVAGGIQSADQANTAAGDEGRRNWGYVQVYGKAVVNYNAGGINGASAGDPWITSIDAAKVGNIIGAAGNAVGEIDLIADKHGAAGGFFLVTPGGSDTSTEVFVRLE